SRRPSPLVGFIVLGIIVVFGGVLAYETLAEARLERALAEIGQQTEATVTSEHVQSKRRRRRSSSSKTRELTYTFVDSEGRTHEATASETKFKERLGGYYPVGHRFTVTYMPGRPERHVLGVASAEGASQHARSTLPNLLFVLGAAGLVGAAIYLRR
ncbi:MAG TPA: DUF3592 domain-containing protein, partial [Myxococcaceae bacterium]|nr:DUF3592 domain-containing protein [Myxococcaceae bacterium]